MNTAEKLTQLKWVYAVENLEALSREAAQKHWTHQEFLDRLLEGECARRDVNSVLRRTQQARFPVPKSLDGFDWNWPKKINRAQIMDLFRLSFIKEHANVILLGGVGLGKTHLATALGQQACEKGYSVLFTTAIDIVNTLAAARIAQRLKQELKHYTRPNLLVVDELGYLPIDKLSADLLFQVFSARYERGSIILTTNKAFKHWPSIFNDDATLASAVLDRLLHHSQAVIIEGPSFRTKHRIEDPS